MLPCGKSQAWLRTTAVMRWGWEETVKLESRLYLIISESRLQFGLWGWSQWWLGGRIDFDLGDEWKPEGKAEAQSSPRNCLYDEGREAWVLLWEISVSPPWRLHRYTKVEPSPQILHVSGASTLGPLFQWSLNFTLAFLGSSERKKHLLLKSGWFYPGWKADVHFDLFLVVWAFINVNHICIGYTWYFCRSYVSTPSSSRQTLTQQWQRCPGTGSSQPHGVVTTDRSKGNLPKVTQLHYVVEQRGIWTQPSSSDLNHHTLHASQ